MPRGHPGTIPVNLVIACLASCLVACAPDAQVEVPADFVFRGGAVYTLDAERPWATAVAVDDGRIVYVGDAPGVDAFIGAGTQVVEIGDGMLMPGFHDAHMHPMAAGSRYLRCPLDDLSWPDEVLTTLHGCADTLEDGAWLRATGLPEDALDGAGPGIAVLDAVSRGHPVIILARFSEIAWLNSAALRLGGIDAATPDPAGGEIVRDPESGTPTGVLRGDAVGLVWEVSTQYSETELREGLRRASRLANSLGITSSNEASTSAGQWSAYRAAEAAGEMTLRVNASLRWDAQRGVEQLPALVDMHAGAAGPRFRADSVKLFLDGSAVGTANLLQPYAGTENFGESHYGDALVDIVAAIDSANLQLHMHAYGDRAVRDGLDAIAGAIAGNPPRDRRHQLAHLALVHPDDLPRFAELGVTADIQPLWAWPSDERREECEAIGEARCKRLLAFRDLFDSGARVVAGSDWISESMSPLFGIQAAVTRRPPDGTGPPWNPGQRVLLEEMLRAYTIEGAWLYGQEEVTGSIEVGKAADLVMLERNLFAVDPMEIRDVEVGMTLLEGEVVYRNSRTADGQSMPR